MKPIRRDHTLGDYFVPEDCHGGVAVDIGSNVGSFLERYAQTFSKIHFYEPIKSCFDLCVKKTQGMGHVKAFHEGVLDRDQKDAGVRTNSLDPFETGCVVDMPHLEEVDPHRKVFMNPFEKVDLVSLETVIDRAGGFVDYLKVDCEGAEYYILHEKDLSKVKYIGIEFHGNLGQERWKSLCLWLNRTHMLVRPEIIHEKDFYFVLNGPIVEATYAPRTDEFEYFKDGDGFKKRRKP